MKMASASPGQLDTLSMFGGTAQRTDRTRCYDQFDKMTPALILASRHVIISCRSSYNFITVPLIPSNPACLWSRLLGCFRNLRTLVIGKINKVRCLDSATLGLCLLLLLNTKLS